MLAPCYLLTSVRRWFCRTFGPEAPAGRGGDFETQVVHNVDVSVDFGELSGLDPLVGSLHSCRSRALYWESKSVARKFSPSRLISSVDRGLRAATGVVNTPRRPNPAGCTEEGVESEHAARMVARLIRVDHAGGCSSSPV